MDTNQSAYHTQIRRVIGNSLLDPDDACGDILKENEFIQLG